MGISYHITIYQSWSTALYHHQIWSWRREVIPAIVEEEEANSWRTKQNSPESYCSGFTTWVIHFHGVGPSPYKTKIMLPSCSFQCFICLCPWSLNSGDNTQREVQCSGFYWLFICFFDFLVYFVWFCVSFSLPPLGVNTRSNILFCSLEVDVCSISFEESNNN